MEFSPNLWLIGCSPMAQSYSAVLEAQNIAYQVIGRGLASAAAFEQVTGRPVFTGGVELALCELSAPEQAILAVGVEQLAPVAQQLMLAGCRHLLLEKPGALHLSELEALNATAQAYGAQVWIAYNRRFFASVQKLRELVAADNGIISASFEFTEWSHIIRDIPKAPGVKEGLVLTNSSHVLDLAFSLIGLPADGHWHAWHSGSLDWHPAGARFHGAGQSVLGIPFSYQADWEAPGRWGLELLTRNNRYQLRPMEELQVTPLGSVKKHSIKLDDHLDHQFKPGLFLQCDAFLSSDPESKRYLCTLNDQLNAFPTYSQIAGYSLS